MQRLANIRTAFWQGGSLWLIEAFQPDEAPRATDFHTHHAIQVVFSLGGWFELTVGTETVRADIVAVAADVPHLFSAAGLMAMLFIEPESRAGRAVRRRLFHDRDIAAVEPEPFLDLCRRLQAHHGGPDAPGVLEGLGRALLAGLAADAPADIVDPRVRRVIAWASERIEGGLSLPEAARVAGLSPGRLRHLFVQETGLPFRTYLLWVRLNLAVGRIVAGASLTEAAHDAGFADSAHFSRTFRRMFGVTAAALHMT